MTSKLLIAYPDIQQSALVVTNDLAYDSMTPIYSASSGLRHNLAGVTTTATGTHYIQYDLGNGVTKAVDYLILARADLLQTEVCTTVQLRADSSPRAGAGGGNLIITQSSFNSETLIGPFAQDWIKTCATSTAYRYWWLEFTETSPANYYRSKNYFGSMFDMGIDPDSYDYQLLGQNYSAVTFPTGNISLSRSNVPRYAFSIGWQAVTDAKALEFQTSILKDPVKHLIFLYAPTNKQILADFTLVHCRVLADQCRVTRVKTNYNIVTAYFEQVVG